MKYHIGEENTTDYNSRHPAEHTDNNNEEDALFVNAIIDADLPDAVTLDIMKKATNEDGFMEKLKYCILKKGYIPTNVLELQPYQQVFLGVVSGQATGNARNSNCNTEFLESRRDRPGT